jgi:nitroreductase
MITTAWSMEVGSVWLGVPLLLREEFDKILNPPHGCELQAIIALGYPDEPTRKRRRKPVMEVMTVV